MNVEAKNDNQKDESTLSEDVVCNSDPVLGIVLKHCCKTRPGVFLFLVVLPLVLFSYFALITWWENRFWYQSILSETNYLGMSFIGDTMVWPYFICVPLLFYLLKSAICETVDLLNDDGNIIRNTPESKSQFADAIKRAENCILYQGRWKAGYYLAIALGFTFWLYNTATCYDPLILGDGLHAYETETPVYIPDKVTIDIKEFPDREQVFRLLNSLYGSQQKPNEKLSFNSEAHQITWTGNMGWYDYQLLRNYSRDMQWRSEVKRLYEMKKGQKLWLVSSVGIPKWDTDIENAPFSWYSTRIWVLLFGYTLLPLMLFRIFNLSWVIRSFYKRLSDNSLLKFDLLSVDDRRNINAVSAVALKISYLLAVFLILTLLSLVKEGVEPEPQNYVFLVLTFIVSFSLFILPILTIRNIVRGEKSVLLKQFTHKLENIYKEIYEIIEIKHPSSLANKRLAVLKENMELQEKRFGKLANYTVWPIRKSTVMKYAASILTPLLLAMAKKFLEGFI